jgi:hypothetical protein
MRKIKNLGGYGVIGWVEVDDLGRIVLGNIGIKVYGKKQDILDELGQYATVAKAHVYVDVPKKIANPTPHTEEKEG